MNDSIESDKLAEAKRFRHMADASFSSHRRNRHSSVDENKAWHSRGVTGCGLWKVSPYSTPRNEVSRTDEWF